MLGDQRYREEDLRGLTVVALDLVEPRSNRPVWLDSPQAQELLKLASQKRCLRAHQLARLFRLMESFTPDQIVVILNDDEEYSCMELPRGLTAKPLPWHEAFRSSIES
ncbi:MAG: hypothetical protein WDN47_03100 [Candidatus Doudnabacteria bacterium]